MHTTIYKIDKQQDLLYSTGKFIQYLIINYNGKNLKKNTYTYICLCKYNQIHCYLYKPHGNHKPNIYNRHTYNKRERNPNITLKKAIKSQKKRAKKKEKKKRKEKN